MPATYSVSVWDHDPDDGSEPHFSAELAREILDGPSAGLTLRQMGQTMRRLREHGFDDVSFLVEREEE